jgi:uncharacterized membrane protein YqjE
LLKVLTATARDRLELAMLEFEEEKRKYMGLLVWTGVALLAGTQSLLLTSLVIIYLVPPSFRPAVAIALILLNWLFVVWAIVRAKSLLHETGRPFEATAEQLRKDLECLKTDD